MEYIFSFSLLFIFTGAFLGLSYLIELIFEKHEDRQLKKKIAQNIRDAVTIKVLNDGQVIKQYEMRNKR